jgi:tripartite-type tricarboxylate transporter receptor subunit TctC
MQTDCLKKILLACLACALPFMSSAQDWPAKPVRIVVPSQGFPPAISDFMPDVPTLAEAGFPGNEFEIWLALYAPAKTPSAIVNRLSQEMKKYLDMPSTKEAFSKLGHESDSAGPEGVRQRIESELKAMLPVVKSAGLLNK